LLSASADFAKLQGAREKSAMPEIYGIDAYSPREVARKVENVGLTKLRLPFLETFMLGVVAGGFIGLGGLYYLLVTSDPHLHFANARVMGGLVFSTGYVVAIIAGAEVFTSNNLQVMTVAAGKASLVELLRKWGIVLCANAVGASGLALLVLMSSSLAINDHAVAARALEVAAAKTGLSFREAFFNGVLGNLLVCIAVWMSIAGRTVTDKLVAMLLPLSAVAALGFEHVVSSLFHVPLGLLLRHTLPGLEVPGMESVTWAGLFGNLVPVTLGNIVGGAVMVALVYYFIYRRSATEAEGSAG
jgi:formate transporter